MDPRELGLLLFQHTYYDSIDRGDMATAVTALREDIEWSHVQVWEHHDYRRRDVPTRLHGRAEVQAFLAERIDKLREAGVKIERRGAAMIAKRGPKLSPVDVTTLPYAGFPTDVQAQMMALMCLTPGISIITERIFESRFGHVAELGRLGADVSIEGPSAIVKGGKRLSGAPVMASDLRASAALVLAGLAAKGATQVNRIYHLDRGYEKIDQKLKQLGGRISRIQE